MSPSLIGIGVIALVVIVLLCMAIYVVPQQQAYIIERFGKFRSVRFAGIHLLIPFVDRIAMKTNMRVSQLNVKLETKTLDNVFVTIVASTQYRVNPDNVAKAYYELRDPQGQLRSYMEDALRSAIPMLTLDDAFARKDSVAADVQQTVGSEMARFGFTVVKTLITAIDPSPAVKSAMDSINAAQREKEATRQHAEAMRIQIETQAAAEAEKVRLQGSLQVHQTGIGRTPISSAAVSPLNVHSDTNRKHRFRLSSKAVFCYTPKSTHWCCFLIFCKMKTQ